MLTLILIALAYLCGSIPVGYLLASAEGIDIRRRGSGNIGATNVARVVGWRHGILTLAGDTAKGLIPVLAARHFDVGLWEVALTGLAAFLGHLYPIFLAFKGGKGVATGLGRCLLIRRPVGGRWRQVGRMDGQESRTDDHEAHHRTFPQRARPAIDHDRARSHCKRQTVAAFLADYWPRTDRNQAENR